MSGYVRTEYPRWSWSFSRDQLFSACRRRYYYNYYASHNGWEFQAEPEAAQSYRLKQLSNIYLVLGDAVHKVAASIVAQVARGKEVPSAAYVEEEIRRQLRRVWRSSQEQLDYFMRRPNRVDMLHEFYYGYGVSKDVIALINERAVKTAQGLTKSSIWETLADSGTKLISCEQFDTFLIEDTPVYAVPDLLLVDSAGEWIIVDWKTGAEVEENREQVALYALYVQQKHRPPFEKIKARLEYLNLDTVQELAFSKEELAIVQQQALKSMAKMRELLVDPEENIPAPKSQFALTDQRDQCRWCNFYELCKEELAESVS